MFVPPRMERPNMFLEYIYRERGGVTERERERERERKLKKKNIVFIYPF